MSAVRVIPAADALAARKAAATAYLEALEDRAEVAALRAEAANRAAAQALRDVTAGQANARRWWAGGVA